MQKSLDKINFRGYHSDSQSGVFSRLWQALLEKTLERLDQVNGDLLFPEGKNVLYFGDNLKRLRKIPSASVDLVYLDPPFNSKQSYNILFKDKKGRKATSQIKAFGDTWRWGEIAEETYEDVVTAGGTPAVAVKALRRMLGQSDMMAYIIMMTPRLVELRRVMKQTGSLYLHCDPTASHYLKIILDYLGYNFWALQLPLRDCLEANKRSQRYQAGQKGLRSHPRVSPQDAGASNEKGPEESRLKRWLEASPLRLIG